jgi:hypothetical protein
MPSRRDGCGKEVQAGIGDQASVEVERGPVAGSADPEMIPKPMDVAARMFPRAFSISHQKQIYPSWASLFLPNWMPLYK